MSSNGTWRWNKQGKSNCFVEKIMFIISFVCLSSFACINIVQGAEKRMYDIPTDIQVLFVPGWKSANNDYSDEIHALSCIFAGKKVCPRPWHWHSDQDWRDAMPAAEDEAKILALLLSNIPEKQREHLILIGHSLGGRIVIHAMAILHQEYKMKIEQGIFLGAAVSDDDPAIQKALKASKQNNLNLYCKEDAVLYRLFRDWGDRSKAAIGTFG